MHTWSKYIAVVLFIVLGMSACGPKKNSITVDGVIVEKTLPQLVADVQAKGLDFTTINGKAKFELTHVSSGKSLKVSAVVKIKKDEIIQISFRALFGYEVAVVSLTPDAFYLVDRYNKQYAVEDISEFAKSNSTFNYYNLQSMLTDGLFLPGEEEILPAHYNKFDLSVASNMYLLKVKDDSKTLYNFAVDGNDRIASVLIYNPDKFTLQWSYKDFIESDGFIYPTTMLANLDAKGNRLDIKIGYDKLDINKELEVNIPEPDPQKYKKVTATDIIKQIVGS